MTSQSQTVLLLGGTGRTGGRVLQQLLERGVSVRAIVRSPHKLPTAVAQDPSLTVIESSVLELPDEDLARHVDGCDSVISCLGHTTNLAGIFGKPRDLVAEATSRVCRAIETMRPEHPVKFVLMSSVSVNRPDRLDSRRGGLERAVLWTIRGFVPPARDNQRAADFLCGRVGASDRFVQWVTVRPDTLCDGEVCEYELHDGLVDGLFKPGKTNMANVADFMCELVASDTTWNDWRCKLPVIVNAA